MRYLRLRRIEREDKESHQNFLSGVGTLQKSLARDQLEERFQDQFQFCFSSSVKNEEIFQN
jgi:hypothetical protein